MSDFEELVPAADTDALGLGVGRRTIGRLVKDPPAGFPPVIRINGRLYFRRAELEAYKKQLIEDAALNTRPTPNHPLGAARARQMEAV